jgi:hypothetical protein
VKSDHVLHAHAQGIDEDKAYSRSFLHDRAIAVHCPRLMLNGCRRSLDLRPLSDKVRQYL